MAKWNPKATYDSIVNLKRDYDNAQTEEEKKKISDDAKQHYNMLQGNGYDKQAGELSKRGYNDAVAYVYEEKSKWDNDRKKDALKHSGDSEFREGFKNLWNNTYSQKITDDDITYEPESGAVKVFGNSIDKNLLSFSDYEDKHYISGDNLKKLVGDIGSRVGAYNNYDFNVNEWNDKSLKAFDDAEAYSNPFYETDFYKGLAGNKDEASNIINAGADAAKANTIEDSSANNNGNFNTYGVALGDEAKSKHLQSWLNMFSGQYDSAFDKKRTLYNDAQAFSQGWNDTKIKDRIQTENEKQGESSRYIAENESAANITGKVPNRITDDFYNRYTDWSDEELENTDFPAEINKYRAIIDNPDATLEQKASAEKIIEDLSLGLETKNKRFGQRNIDDPYADIYGQPTEAAREFDETSEFNDKSLNLNYALGVHEATEATKAAEAKAETDKDIAEIEDATKRYEIDSKYNNDDKDKKITDDTIDDVVKKLNIALDKNGYEDAIIPNGLNKYAISPEYGDEDKEKIIGLVEDYIKDYDEETQTDFFTYLGLLDVKKN